MKDVTKISIEPMEKETTIVHSAEDVWITRQCSQAEIFYI